MQLPSFLAPTDPVFVPQVPLSSIIPPAAVTLILLSILLLMPALQVSVSLTVELMTALIAAPMILELQFATNVN